MNSIQTGEVDILSSYQIKPFGLFLFFAASAASAASDAAAAAASEPKIQRPQTGVLYQ